MKVEELIEQLQILFPSTYRNQQTVDAWAERFRGSLKNFQGEDLRKAFDACLADWDKATFPKPADIVRHLPNTKLNASNFKRFPSEQEIFRHPCGQQALREGTGIDYHAHRMRGGDAEITASTFQEFARAAANSARIAASLENKKDALSKRIFSLYGKLRSREEYFAEKYLET